MRPLVPTLFIILAIFFAGSCNPPAQTLGEKYQQDIDSTILALRNIPSPNADVLHAVKKEIPRDSMSKEKQKDSLTQLFIIRKDDYSNLTFFNHKHWGSKWPAHSTIYAYLNSGKDIYLVSNFYSSDWIFHTRVKVLIDGRAYDTDEVPSYNPSNITQNGGRDVWENVTYPPGNSKHIIKEIASNTDKRISVRFEGKQHEQEIVLSDQDKTAFKDVYTLWLLNK